jgi:hypothetical protein
MYYLLDIGRSDRNMLPRHIGTLPRTAHQRHALAHGRHSAQPHNRENPPGGVGRPNARLANMVNVVNMVTRTVERISMTPNGRRPTPRRPSGVASTLDHTAGSGLLPSHPPDPRSHLTFQRPLTIGQAPWYHGFTRRIRIP